MKLNKLLLLLLPLSLVACNNKQKDPEKPDPSLLTTPLCMTCTSDVNMGLVKVMHASQTAEDNFSLQYSKDNRTWNDVEFNEMQKVFILKKDETIYFRGNNPEGFNVFLEEGTEFFYERLTMFVAIDGDIDLGGNIMSLLSPTDFDQLTEIPCDYCFDALFGNIEGDSLFNDASKLSLPATKLTKSCYNSMFGGNVNLVNAPKLPATTLVEDCYFEMFNGCTSLKHLEVAFDETAFVKKDSEDEYKYTNAWLPEVEAGDDAPTFVWLGTLGEIERSTSTIPENWEIKAPEEVL